VRRGSRAGVLDLGEVRARRLVSEARLSNGFGATLRAEVGFNQTAPVLGEAYESLLNQQRLGFSVAMPIVQWGGGRADVQAALAEQSRQASLDRAARRTIAQEGRFAARELALAERQLTLAAKADTVAAKRFEVAKNRYVIGRIDIGDLFIAQSEKDNALRAYVNAERGYWVAYYRLRRLTLYDFERGAPIADGRE
jgi:outer membrane protein TolC